MGAVIYNLQRIRFRLFKIRKPYKLISKYSNFPLIARPNTSDLSVFYQIFTQREYSCLDEITDADLIIDCGANVGYSSAYFLSRFPKANLISIEPDTENYSLMTANLAPFNGRVRMLNTAIWSHEADLRFLESSLGPKKEWARRLVEIKEGESASLKAIDIGSLLQSIDYSTISILKIDVEGAEEVIFASNYESWINNVENIVIEIHNKRAKKNFFDAISNVGFSCSQFGELTICKK